MARERARTNYERARALMARQRPKAAMAACRLALQEDPGDARAIALEARSRAFARELSFADARNVHLELLDRHTGDAALIIGAAVLSVADGERAEGVAELRRLAADRPDDPRVHVALGGLLSADRTAQEEAWGHYRAALADGPLEFPSHRALAYRVGLRVGAADADVALAGAGPLARQAIRTIARLQGAVQFMAVLGALGVGLCVVGYAVTGVEVLGCATAVAAWLVYCFVAVGLWTQLQWAIGVTAGLWLGAVVAVRVRAGDRWLGPVAAVVIVVVGLAVTGRGRADPKGPTVRARSADSPGGQRAPRTRRQRLAPFLVIATGFVLLALVPRQTVVPTEVATTASIDVGPSPAQLAISPDGLDAYVVDTDSSTLYVVDLRSHVVTRVTVGADLTDVAVSPAGGQLYVTSDPIGTTGVRGTVYVLNARSLQVTATIDVGGGSDLVAFSPTGATAYVAHADASAGSGEAVSAVDVGDRRVGAPTPIAPFPQYLLVSPDGTALYVESGVGGNQDGSLPAELQEVNTSTGRVVLASNQGDDPPCGLALAPSGRVLYESFCASVGQRFSVPSMRVISTSTDATVGTVAIRYGSRGIAVASDGKVAYTADDASVGLDVIDTATRAVTARIVIPTSERLFPILNTIALGPRSDQLYALSNSGFTQTPRLLIVDLPGGH